MIYDQDNAFNEELTDRRCLDLYEDPVNCIGYKTYTDDDVSRNCVPEKIKEITADIRGANSK